MTNTNPSKFFAAQALHQVLPKLDRLMRQVEHRAGATGQQLSAIAAISEFGKDRLHLLASHEGVSRPTMSRLINTLEDRKWVEKHVDKEDRRTPRLSVTDLGQKILVESCEERTQVLIALMDELNKEECSVLSTCLRKLNRPPGSKPL